MPVFKDTFNRSDGALGPNWECVSGADRTSVVEAYPSIENLKVAIKTESLELASRAVCVSSLKPGLDQYSQCSVYFDVTGYPASVKSGILLRYDRNTFTGYRLSTNRYTSGGQETVFQAETFGPGRVYNSTPTVYNYLSMEVFGPANSTSVRCYGRNSVEDDWTLVFSYDELDQSAYITGTEVGFYSTAFNADIYIDDFECGDYPRAEDQEEPGLLLERDMLYQGNSQVFSLSISSGETSAVLPITNFNIRKRSTGNNYLQVSIPFAPAHANILSDMPDGVMTLSGGVIVSGQPLMREIITTDINLVADQRSPMNQTITLSGYEVNPGWTGESHDAQAVIYRATSNGLRRIRIGIFDHFINPGDTIVDNGSEMVVSYYAANVSVGNAQMEIAEGENG